MPRGKKKEKEKKTPQELLGDVSFERKAPKKKGDTPKGSPQKPPSNQGVIGKPIEITTNYHPIKFPEDFDVFKYQVKWTPKALRSHQAKRSLLSDFLDDFEGMEFHGASLFVPFKKLEVNDIEVADPENEGDMIKISFLWKKKHKKHWLPFVSSMFKRSFDKLKEEDPNLFISLRERDKKLRLEIRELFEPVELLLDHGEMHCIHVQKQFLHMDTIFDLMQTFSDMSKFAKAICGLKVITTYDETVHTVTGVNFSLTPESLFDFQGQSVSYAEFYSSRYGQKAEITHLDQPLLKTTGGSQFLIPELCKLFGITPKMWADPDVKNMIKWSHSPTMVYKQKVQNFTNKLVTERETRQKLLQFNIRVDEDFLNVVGRVLPPPMLRFKKGSFTVLDDCWSETVKTTPLLRTGHSLNNWVILIPDKMKEEHEVFNNMLRLAQNMGMASSKPVIFCYSGKLDDLSTKLSSIRESAVTFMLIIVTSAYNTKRDSLIYKRLFVENAVPCEIVSEEFLFRSNPPREAKYLSNIEQLMLKICTKIGNSPWEVEGLPGILIVGLDSSKDQKNNIHYHGMVASMSGHDCYHHKVWTGPHLSHELSKHLIDAVEVFTAHETELPQGILIYLKIELKKEVIKSLVSDLEEHFDSPVKLTIVNVQEKHKSKFLTWHLPSGTVVDYGITQPNRYDFFLLSRKTAFHLETPTYYDVIYDSMKLTPDELQIATFGQCHMSFPSTRPEKIPGVLNYVQKLLNISIRYLEGPPNPWLDEKLFFL